MRSGSREKELDARPMVKVKVLNLDMGLEAEDEEYGLPFYGTERFRGAKLSKLRYPVIRIEMRVGVSEPIGWGEPSEENARRAAELLLGAKREPWWKRWWRSERRKAKGTRWKLRLKS